MNFGMKKLLILFLLFFCLAIVSADTAEATKYAPDLTVSRVTVDADGNNTGGFSIKNVGNRPTGQFEILVYFKKHDGSYFQQLYRTGNTTTLGVNYTKHYANVFDGSQAVTGLIRVNPHQRFTELNYYNNIRYFSMQKKQVSSYNVTEGVRRYDAELGYDVVTPTYNDTFNNGEYNPILGDPYIDEGSSYVNGIRLLPTSVPQPQHKIIVRGLTTGNYVRYLYSTTGASYSLQYDSLNNYYYKNYPDTIVPAYLGFGRNYVYTVALYNLLNGIGPISVEIDGQSVGSYDVEEVVLYLETGARYVLHEGTYADGEYDPIIANPPYVRIGSSDRYINWIYVDFEVPLLPKQLILSGANSTATIKVKNSNYEVNNMVWDSEKEYFTLETYYSPLVFYIDAGEYDGIESYQFLDSFQQIYLSYIGQNFGYTVYEGYWESSGIDNDYVLLYQHTFTNGGYNPVMANPPYIGSQFYVNHLEFDLNYAVPANAVSSLLILKGTTEVDSPPQVQLADDSLIDMIWSSVKNYYFLYIFTDLIKGVIIDVWSDEYWAYDTLDSFGNIIFEYMYMPRSWSWS